MERLESGLLGDQELMVPWRGFFEAVQRLTAGLDRALKDETGADLAEFSFSLRCLRLMIIR